MCIKLQKKIGKSFMYYKLVVFTTDWWKFWNIDLILIFSLMSVENDSHI